MNPEPELGETDDPRALVRGDAAAVGDLVGRLVGLAAGCATTAAGLQAVPVDAWTGAAAEAFRTRFTQAPPRWSRAADALDTAARAWDRFRVALVAAQDQAAEAAARFRAGAVASAGAREAYAVAAAERRSRAATGAAPGPVPTLDDAGAGECAAARRLLAEARARRTAAAADAARAIAAAAAAAPDPPTGWDRRLAEAIDWQAARAHELADVAEGVGEGVESLVRSARMVDPTDPYYAEHPIRFVVNTSAAVAEAVDTLDRPLRLVTSLLGAGWGSDPARAFGRLLPGTLAATVGVEGGSPEPSLPNAARPSRGPSLPSSSGSSRESWPPSSGSPPGWSSGSLPRSSGSLLPSRATLWADPRPTARPFAPPPGGGGIAAADRTTAAVFEAISRIESRIERLAPAAPDLPTWSTAPVTPRRRRPRSPNARPPAPEPPRPEPQAAEPQAATPPGAEPQAAAPPGAEPQAAAPPGAEPQAAAPPGAEPQAAAPQAAAPQAAAPQAAAPQAAEPPGAAPPGAVPGAAGPPSAPRPIERRDRSRRVEHDSGRARRARLTRADKDFASPLSRSGARKAHLDERGDLVPANPEGDASVVEHVIGRSSRVKSDSPYSSFTGPSARAEVDFGGFAIEVDVVRLQADIDAGILTDVDVLAPHRVQAAIQADADRIVGRAVDLYVRRGRSTAAARSYGLDAAATAALRQRMIDMANAQRHHEWMIRGTVPGRYIVGPHARPLGKAG